VERGFRKTGAGKRKGVVALQPNLDEELLHSRLSHIIDGRDPSLLVLPRLP